MNRSIGTLQYGSKVIKARPAPRKKGEGIGTVGKEKRREAMSEERRAKRRSEENFGQA